MNTQRLVRWIVPLLLLPAHAPAAPPQPGVWRAWLVSPGGDLPFGLHLGGTPFSGAGASERTVTPTHAWIVNGTEKIEVERFTVEANDRVILAFDHYDAIIEATTSNNGRRLDGLWRKTTGSGKESWLPFHAIAHEPDRFNRVKAAGTLDTRWSVRFNSSDDPAVGIFEPRDDGVVHATFMTTTGDYRFLEGRYDTIDGIPTLRLSVFDGAHAFLFKATRKADGSLTGDFWSRDAWHETWTATPDPGATLPDAFAQTTWQGGDLNDLVFTSLDGTPTSVESLRTPGRPMILEVFGSWRPNCHDACDLLTELDRTYGPRGLDIVGLAFELTGDHLRDAQQVRRFQARHGATYPVLIAGIANKTEAGKRLPVLDRVRSYPTTIFIDGDGKVRSIHTGFSGPATGASHTELKSHFAERIEDMLDDSPQPNGNETKHP